MLHISDINNETYFEAPATELRFAGYNMHTSFVTDPERQLKEFPQYVSSSRLKFQGEMLSEMHLDIMALVEFSPEQGKKIKTMFPDKHMVGYFSGTLKSIDEVIAIVDEEAREGKFDYIKNVDEAVVIMYDTSKFKLISQELIVLPKGARHKRIAVWIVLESLHPQAEPRRINVLCTHLDHLSQESRAASLKQLSELIKTLEGEILFYGDLNLFPDANGQQDYLDFVTSVQERVSDPVADHSIPHFGPYGTYPGHSCVSEKFLPKQTTNLDGKVYIPQSNRLDVIMTSMKVAYSHTMLMAMDLEQNRLVRLNGSQPELMRNLMFPSDHLPIMISAF